MERLITNIKMSLGHPLVTVELSDEDIQFIAEESLLYLNQYASDKRFMTINVQGKTINLLDSEYAEIHSIVQVMKSSQATSDSSVLGDTIGMSYQAGYSMSSQGLVPQTLPQVMLERKALSRLSESLEEPISYRQNGSTVYFSDGGTLTLEYTPKWKSVDDLDDYWYDIVTRYAEAKCKITIGRARKKFTSSKALHEIDSSMLDEGNELLTSIVESIRSTDLLDPEVI
jgi:hypothetical protein